MSLTGDGCDGNGLQLEKLAKLFELFPNVYKKLIFIYLLFLFILQIHPTAGEFTKEH